MTETIQESLEKYVSHLTKLGFEPKLEDDKFSIKYKNRRLNFLHENNPYRMHSVVSMVTETFEGEYDSLKVDKRTVVDIGAYTGETAIYFALNGAEHVYSFEPFPQSYELAKKNIEENRLTDKITLINRGCGKEGKVKLDDGYMSEPWSSTSKKFNEGKEIEIMSLDNVVKSFNIQSGSRLKVDCEGCEVPIIMESSEETITKFNRIYMEYHYGYEKIMNRLHEMLYTVSYQEPRDFKNPEAEDQDMVMGVMAAQHVPTYFKENGIDVEFVRDKKSSL